MIDQAPTPRSEARGDPAHRFERFVRRWRHSRILSAFVTVAGLSGAVKLLVVGKDLVVADLFGTSAALDAFVIALAVPLFATTVIAGSFNSSFIPAYIWTREHRGADAAQRLLETTLTIAVALLASVGALLAVFCSPLLHLLAPRFTGAQLVLARHLFLTMLPIVVFSGISTLSSATLNAVEQFAAPVLASIMTPLLPIVLLLTLARWWGIEALAWGTDAGYLLEMVALGIVLHRQGLSPRPRWGGLDEGVRRVAAAYLPMVAGAVASSASPLVDQAMASRLGDGSVSGLSYGNKLISFAVAIGATALSTAILPHFSRLVAKQGWAQLRSALRRYAFAILLVSVPVTLGLALFSRPIIRLLYQRGAFTAQDTHVISGVLMCYAFQLPAYFLGILGVRLLSAAEGNAYIMKIAFLNVLLNITLDWLFMKWIGLAGIALSTSCVYWFSTTLVLLTARRLISDRARRSETVATA